MDIREAQAALIALGYDLGPTGADGDWGKLSRKACGMFQRGRGLASLGELTPDTAAALHKAVGARKSPCLVPADWMPVADMERVIVHWTAGNHKASTDDRKHYHLLIEADGNLVRGVPSIALNDADGTKAGYAAHTLNCNTGSIGVSLCCMAGAIESPFKAGSAPMTRKQWDTAAVVVADLCRRYGITVSPRTVLSHAEVQETLGIKQRGKWDIAHLAFDSSIVGAKACGIYLRTAVANRL
jgi:hypothetical protein